jgi:heat shock protein HslJ
MRYVQIVVLSVTMIGCAAGSAAKKLDEAPMPGGNSGVIIAIDWLLLEVRTAEALIDLERSRLEAEGMGDVFSLRFDGEDRVSGKAAPNRYTAPCSWGDDNTLGIGPAAATMMMAIKEPEALKEREFFDYLTKVNRWSINTKGQLELYTSAGITLVFGKIPPF